MLRAIYYIVIDGLDVYKSSGIGPRLKNMLHNWHKILDNCPTCNVFFESFNYVHFYANNDILHCHWWHRFI